jgi:GNAT superfamily N-acetyltransferase
MEGARLAVEGDLPTCRELLHGALEGARTMRGGAALIGSATENELLARWTDGPEAAALLVGEFHEVIVGLAAVVTFSRPEPAQLAGRIECLYVEPDARGVGVGSALMTAAVAWLRQQSCVEVDALALPGDRSSKQRYEGAGFTARLITLSRRLD